ncbi:MAG TPA: N-acetylglucosamine-6-phosphate deacetylase [Oscillibacter sp.]|nr:MAG: N-acetylglucosamine-6-phosphate deacetylase [Oscillibacter sp.]HBL64075.1 N-acetylglucosamine-6-phosphate deacetylase [Oscillibacter sp.]HCV07467.1 N-acetylglucosamine-6-phosphate deacetylase [Oscillibacter sp.]
MRAAVGPREARDMRYENGWIFADGRFVRGGFSVENGRFAHVLEDVPGPAEDLDGALVIPGLVDIHVHGCAGADFSDGDYAGLVRMARYLARRGVTSFAPASMTLPYDALDKAFHAAARLHREGLADGARLMGIQMEGPFLSREKRGSQNPAYLRLPDWDRFLRLYDAAEGLLRIVDVAPELPGAVEFTRRASEKCRVSVAHTAAGYDQAAAVFDAGATHLTHLFNAMSGIHHRHPGPIGAASERENVTAELICDGIHVHPSAVRMAFRLFPGRICLISDALRCCGMADGSYSLGGQEILLSGGVARLTGGAIAGSAADLYQCMRRAVSFGIPREQAVWAATALPARVIGRESETGAIADGRAADFVICGGELEPEAVYLGGKRLEQSVGPFAPSR